MSSGLSTCVHLFTNLYLMLFSKSYLTQLMRETFQRIAHSVKNTGSEAMTSERVRDENLVFLSLYQNICCVYSKEPSQ